MYRITFVNTDVFLVCFSVINPDSYDNVRERWVPEIQKYWGQAPFLLVGTQMDLRTDRATITNLGEIYNDQIRIRTIDISEKEMKKPVNVEQGKRLASELGAVAYLECSALTQEGMKNVFDKVTSRNILTFMDNFLILSLLQALMAALNEEDEGME